MVEPKIRELINRDVDGVLGSEEHARLHRSLRRNAPARKLHKDLMNLTTALGSVRTVDPPVHLANRIRAAVYADDAPVAAVRPANTRWRSSLLRILHPSTTLRYGYLFAGGLVAGFLLFFIALDGESAKAIGDSDLTGTLVLHGPAPGFSSGDFFEISSEAAKGSVETQCSPGFCLIRISLEDTGGVLATLTTNPSAVRLEAVRPFDDPGARLSVRDGEIALQTVQGGRLVVLYAAKGGALSPAHLTLNSSGRTVFDRTISMVKTK